MADIFFTIMRFATKEEVKRFWETLEPATERTFENYDWHVKTWCEKYSHLDDTEDARAMFFNRLHEAEEELNSLLSLIRDIQTSYERFVEVEDLEKDPFYISLWNILEKYS
ncbi:MAG: hypothetical protein NC177_14175 [Ruminococcus flavefaciens]|nr:hypothetical protein [Ruminococcus flavefaciens]